MQLHFPYLSTAVLRQCPGFYNPLLLSHWLTCDSFEGSIKDQVLCHVHLSSSLLILLLLLFRAMHVTHHTRKPQLCKPASSCPSLPSSTLHITSSFESSSCMLSQVQENWAREPFEFALCIRLPYCEELSRLTLGQFCIGVLFLTQVNTNIHFH